MAIAFRFCIGLGNGFMAVAKTVVSEITSCKEHELKAFGILNGYCLINEYIYIHRCIDVYLYKNINLQLQTEIYMHEYK